MIRGTFASGDEIKRADARALGYATVVGHPVEIRDLEPDGFLVLDIDHMMFGDRKAAIDRAKSAAEVVSVGIRTYYPDDPRLDELRTCPNVVIAKTHRRLLAALRGGRRTRPVRATTIDTVPDRGKVEGSGLKARQFL